VVITRRPVYEYVPLAKNDDAVVCQYVMTTLEELGLLKMDCEVDTHNIVIMHVGDSSFNPNQYSVEAPVDVLIPRYASTIDYKIIGPVIQPKVILMSHIMELRHVNKPGSRSSIMQGLEHNQSFYQSKAYLPFWGELFVYSR
jgi:hypothetical protein